MTTPSTSGRLTDSSVAVAVIRRLARGIVRGVSKTVTAAKQTNARMAIGLRREPKSPPASSEQLEALIKDSRTVRALVALASAPIAAWQHARAKRLLDAFTAIEPTARIRLVGCALFTAVVTHTAVIAAIGVHTFGVGWVTRVIAAAAAAALMAWPGVFAAAWKDRASR